MITVTTENRLEPLIIRHLTGTDGRDAGTWDSAAFADSSAAIAVDKPHIFPPPANPIFLIRLIGPICPPSPSISTVIRMSSPTAGAQTSLFGNYQLTGCSR
jgi:hypothetical protein